MGLEARSVPPLCSQDCGIARRCKLFLGTELERGAMVQGDLIVGPPMERRREFAAANLHDATAAALTCVSDQRKCPVDCARRCRSIFAMYVRANSSILMFARTVTCRTNPVRMPGVIVRLCPLAWSTGLQGQINPLASCETTVLKTRFGPGDAGDPLRRSIAFERTSTERSCHLGKGPTDTRIQV